MSDRTNVGKILEGGNNAAMRGLAILIGVVCYLGGLVYTAVHQFSLITRGVEPDFVLWALFGVFLLELTAVGLPLALHYWTFEARHRMAAFAFYTIDIALIVGNVVADYTMNSRGDMAEWLRLYISYIVPVTPVVAMLIWSALLLLDPSYRLKAFVETAKEALQTAQIQAAVDKFKDENVDRQVAQAGAAMADTIVGATFARDGAAMPQAGGGDQTYTRAEVEKMIRDAVAKANKTDPKAGGHG
jgi:hypothetical protein